MSIDLAKLGMSFLRKGAQKSQPAISGVVISTLDSEVVAKVQKALKDAGIDLPISKAVEADGATILSADESFDGAGTKFRFSDDTALVVKGFEPYGQALAETSFSEAVQSRGFYDGMYTSMGVLCDRVVDTLMKADTPDAAASAIGPLLNDFSTYLTGLVKALPTTVFKAENVVQEVLKAEKMAGKGKDKQTCSDDNDADEKGKGKESTKKEDAPSATEGEVKAPEVVAKSESESTAPTTETPTATAAPDLSKVLDAVAALSNTVSALVTKTEKVDAALAAIEAAQKATDEKVAASVQKAEDLQRAVQGTVVNTAPPDTTQAGNTVRKADNDPRTGAFDTAFIRR